MRYVIWYYLYNLKNVKYTHGGVLILVNLQAEALFTFFKLCQIAQRTTYSIHEVIKRSNVRLI